MRTPISFAGQIEKFLYGRWAVVVLVLGWLAFSIPSLMTYPAVDSDEVLFSSVAKFFYEMGGFFSPVRYISGQAESTGMLHGRLYAVIIGLSYQLTGVGVLQGRLVAMLGCLFSGLLVQNIGRALGLSRPAGLAAVALYWTSWRTLFASHSMRPEMWIVVGGLLMVYMHLRSRRTPTAVQYLMLGFVLGYLLDIHVPTVFYSAVVGMLVGLDFLARRIGPKQFMACVAGAALGIAAWMALWLLPDPVNNFRLPGGGPLAPTSSDSILHPRGPLTQAVQFGVWLNESFITSTRIGGIEAAFVAAAAAVLLWGRTSAGKYLLTCSGLLMLTLFVTPYRHGQHAVLVTPLASLLVACAADMIATLRINRRGLLAPALVVPLLGLYIAGVLSLSWRSRPLSYAEYASALRQFIPLGANVLGEDTWWFEFHDGIYTSDLRLPNSKRSADELYALRLNNLRTRQVEYILVDERLGSAWQEPLSKSESEFVPVYERLLNDYCQSVGAVDLPYIGVERGGPANKRTTIWHCFFEP